LRDHSINVISVIYQNYFCSDNFIVKTFEEEVVKGPFESMTYLGEFMIAMEKTYVTYFLYPSNIGRGRVCLGFRVNLGKSRKKSYF